MIHLLTQPASTDQIKSASEDLDGYIKFVVDLDNKIITIGGLRHVDGEETLLQRGSLQTNLWGGGYDTETKEMDFDSMINIRPSDNNRSRIVESKNIQEEIEKIVRNFIS